MHTLKGAARSVGQRDVERVCASCEALLSALTRAETLPGAGGGRAARGGGRGDRRARRDGRRARATGRAPPRPRCDAACDARGRVRPRRRRRAAPARRRAAPRRCREPRRRRRRRRPPPRASRRAAATIRLATDDLDALLRRGEDLLAIKLAADEWVAGAEAFHEQLRRARSRRGPAGRAARARGARARRWSPACGATGARSPAPSTGCSSRRSGCG